MATGKRNRIQEERRKTLGGWVAFSTGGNQGFPHEPPPLPIGTGHSQLTSPRAKPGSGGRRELTEALSSV